jgi:sulfite exporter TauE/SafE
MPNIAAIYAQELAIGLPWTATHCAAMCGPLLAGLRAAGAGPYPSGTSGGRPLAPLEHLLFHQLGRAGPYLAAGAVVGGCGALIGQWRYGSAALAAGAVAAFLLAALHQLVPALGARLGWALPAPGGRRLAALLHSCAGRPRLAALAAGALLSGLPCGVAGWTLALAAATASPWHGAGVMAVLLALNSLPLAAAALAPAAWRRLGLRTPRWLVPACLLLSAATTLTLALGALRAGACPLCLGHG